MNATIHESDWKVVRELKPIALDRFCRQALDDIRRTSMTPGASAHEIYLQVYRLIEARDQALGELFNDLKRSNAFFRIGLLRRAGLINDEEYARFSEELREKLEFLRSLGGS